MVGRGATNVVVALVVALVVVVACAGYGEAWNDLDGAGSCTPEIALDRVEAAARAGADTLDLSSCGLAAVPKGVFQLASLTRLYLHNNVLERLDADISKLVSFVVAHRRIPVRLCSLSRCQPPFQLLS